VLIPILTSIAACAGMPSTIEIDGRRGLRKGRFSYRRKGRFSYTTNCVMDKAVVMGLAPKHVATEKDSGIDLPDDTYNDAVNYNDLVNDLEAADLIGEEDRHSVTNIEETHEFE
jgi:hypothetical protein